VDSAAFAGVAPYLREPLVLVGFVLLLFFGVTRALIRSRLLTPVSGARSYRVLQTVLLYGFLISIIVIALGFGLKYRELTHAEQRNAVDLMLRELDGNLVSVEALRRNTIVLLDLGQQVAMLLREPDLKVIAVLFPAENLRPDVTISPKQMAVEALSRFLDSGLERNKVEMARGNAAAKAISGTIQRTRGTVVSLCDMDRHRYIIRDDAWQANLPVLRRVFVEGIPELQQSYRTAQKLRSDYDVVCTSVLAYLDALRSVFSRDPGVDVDSLAATLAQERQTWSLLSVYATSLADNLESLHATQKRFEPTAGADAT
jgi:hypothetical protein